MTLKEQPLPVGEPLAPPEITEWPEGGNILTGDTALTQMAINVNSTVPQTATIVFPNAKVEIPRQRSDVTRSIRRVSRACHSCRQRKMKCTGDTPTCQKCSELGVNCEYPAGFRERKTR